MTTINDSPLWIDGVLVVGNFTCGRTEVFSGTAEAPVNISVTGLELTGTGNVYVQLTNSSRQPGAKGHTAGHRLSMYYNATETSFGICSLRQAGTDHIVDWMAYRDPA